MTTTTTKGAPVSDDKLLNRPIGRARAVRFVCEALADRTHFLLLPPAGRAAEVAALLDGAEIPWVGYLDNGMELALRTDQAALLAVTESFAPLAVVMTVPKTVPAAKLANLLDREIPADGSRDLLVLTDSEHTQWPMLFVAALDKVDPKAAASIRANAVAVG
jgi:hypothetical protein